MLQTRHQPSRATFVWPCPGLTAPAPAPAQCRTITPLSTKQGSSTQQPHRCQSTAPAQPQHTIAQLQHSTGPTQAQHSMHSSITAHSLCMCPWSVQPWAQHSMHGTAPSLPTLTWHVPSVCAVWVASLPALLALLMPLDPPPPAPSLVGAAASPLGPLQSPSLGHQGCLREIPVGMHERAYVGRHEWQGTCMSGWSDYKALYTHRDKSDEGTTRNPTTGAYGDTKTCQRRLSQTHTSKNNKG